MQDMLVDSPDITANELLLAKTAAETLHKHYPGHLWGVHVDGAIINIRDLSVSGKWGYTLHLTAQYSASDFERNVMKAGGEILERYRVARAKLNQDHLNSMPTDVAGNLML